MKYLNHLKRNRFQIVLMALLLSFCFFRENASAKDIVDMAGRTVTVPEKISRIYGTSPPATNLICAVAPEKLAGLNTPIREREKKFTAPCIMNLPVVGGWFGQGQTPNMETLMAVRPDLILVWRSRESMKNMDIEKTLKPLNAPLVFVVLDHVEDYPALFRFMGRLLNEEKRAEILALYAEKTLYDMKAVRNAVPDREKVTVYYAENDDGLSTECADSIHAELIALTGGVNVHSCKAKEGYGMDKVSMEQVLLYDPQVIITHSLPFYTGLLADRRWQSIRAVKEKRVYLIPREPMNWFDRPPSFMRLIGARWLAHNLYPALYPLNVDEETHKFYSLFLERPLSKAELREILTP